MNPIARMAELRAARNIRNLSSGPVDSIDSIDSDANKRIKLKKLKESKGQKVEKDSETELPEIIWLQKYGKPPTEDIPLATAPPRLDEPTKDLLCDYVIRQGEPVVRWALGRANRYEKALPDWTTRTSHVAAALDCILWQRSDRLNAKDRAGQTREVITLLESLEDAVNHFAQQWPAKTEGGQST